MRAVVIAVIALAVSATIADAKRTKVRIYKPSAPAQQPANLPLAAVPVVGVAFDFARRTSCDPRVAVGTGKGDPGFDPAGPKVGNFLIPAIYRSQCQAQPK